MQVLIESLEGLERKMTVQIPSDTVTKAVEKRLKDLTRTVRVDGFRPGKVPLKVVQRKYGGHVRQEVIGNVIESSYREAISQENIHPAGMPTIQSVDSEGVEEVSYTAVFEVYPEIENLQLESIKIEQVEAEVVDADYEAMIQKLRDQRKEWLEVERAATTGDQVMVDFEGRIDDEVFDGGSGTDMAVEIGAGEMLAEFETSLDGMSAGEEKTIEVNFPIDYHGKDVAGKKAIFSLKATKVSEAKLPEVDVAFVKAFGIEDGDLEKFAGDVRNNMKKELNQRIKQVTRDAALNGLLAANEVIAPSAMVTEEVKNQKIQMVERMGQNPSSFDLSSLADEMFQETAKKRVQIGLLVHELIKSEKIEVDVSRVETTLQDMAAAYQDPTQITEYYRQNREAKAALEAMVLEEQVVEHILGKAIVTKKRSSFDEMMNGAPQ